MPLRPDRRFWYALLPLGALLLVDVLLNPQGSFFGKLLSVAIAFFGLSVAAITVREGRVLLNPSITQGQWPVRFWAFVSFSAAIGAYGIWKLWEYHAIHP